MTTTEAHPYILTARQQTVLFLLSEGKSTAEIMKILCFSDRTIKNAIADMLVMFGTKNRTGLVAKALRAGVIK